ncbi:MAG: RNA polymerase sigma factor [Bacteroidetes bacterium]|nr:RNA polymerase sigma factor [Bacteroidota bacterium]
MNPAEERECIQKAASGDHRAFRQLVELHSGLAYTIAFRMTRDVDESEDIVQEAFVRVWKNIHRYDAGFRFRTWIAKIVTNLSLDYLKSPRSKKWSGLELVENMAEPMNANTVIESSELKSAVFRLAEQLTPKQKAVFVLRDLEMMEPEEVCKALDMQDGNMKSNLFHARKKIKEGLEKWYQKEIIWNAGNVKS